MGRFIFLACLMPLNAFKRIMRSAPAMAGMTFAAGRLSPASQQRLNGQLRWLSTIAPYTRSLNSIRVR
jgi:hypothetical protein